jgi:hypothetical protein
MVFGDWSLVIGGQGRPALRAGKSEFTSHQSQATSHHA